MKRSGTWFLVRGAVLVLLSAFFGQFFWFLARWFIARFFGPTDYGILQFTLSATSMLYLVFAFGSPVVVTRADTRSGEHLRLTSSFFIVSTAIFVVSILVSFFLAPWLASKFDVPTSAIYAAIFAAYFFSIFQLTISTFRAVHRIREKVLIDNLFTRILLATTAVLLAYFGVSYLALPLVYFISSLAAIVVFFRIFGRIHFYSSTLPVAIRSGFIYSLSAFATIFIVNTDVLMLAWLLGPTAVGIYGVALIFLQMLRSIANSILYPLYPSFSHAPSSEELRRIYSRGVLLTLLFFLPLGFTALLFPDAILSLFGRDYISAVQVLRVFGLFAIFAPVFVHSPALSAALCRDRLYLIAGFISALLNVFLNYVLIRCYGILGAAVSTFFSLLLLYLIHYGYNIRSGLELRPGLATLRVYALAALFFVFAWLVSEILHLNAYAKLFAALFASLVWFYFSLRLLGVSLHSIINRYLL